MVSVNVRCAQHLRGLSLVANIVCTLTNNKVMRGMHRVDWGDHNYGHFFCNIFCTNCYQRNMAISSDLATKSGDVIAVYELPSAKVYFVLSLSDTMSSAVIVKP